ncbi:MAG: DUF262 domain-containing protein [Planctomycetes bacterium]|nr:DUF262 domain-containing protein [Planctomycetota bacterium]
MSKKRKNPTEVSEFEEKVRRAEEQIVAQSKRIEFYLTEYSVELLASKMKDGEFTIPKYQREDIWEPDRKSRFIESLLMGLPIPFLFFWEKPDGRLEIVDGSQRLRTISQFLQGELRLGELSELSELEGLRFQNLPESRQRKIKNRSIRGIVLNEHADVEARFDIFDRINTGSKIAKPPEVRRGALVGPFLDLVIKLAENETFVKLAPVPETSVKMRKREDMVTRFFAYGDGLDGYKDKPAIFLFDYAEKMNGHFSTNADDVAEYEARFLKTMAFVEKVFPDGFRKSQTAKDTYLARFEAIAIGTYLAIAEQPDLADKTPDVSEWLNGDDFEAHVRSGGSNVRSKLVGRLHIVRDKLLGR